jgi:hypothetical protein
MSSLPIRLEFFCNLLHLLFSHVLPLPTFPILQLIHISTHQRGHSPLDTQISRREDIHPLQPEAGKHLHAPSPQPPHFDQLFQHLLIRRREEHGRAELAAVELLREPKHVLGLALREACSSQDFDGLGADLGGGWEGMLACVLGTFIEEGYEFGLDGSRSCA